MIPVFPWPYNSWMLVEHKRNVRLQRQARSLKYDFRAELFGHDEQFNQFDSEAEAFIKRPGALVLAPSLNGIAQQKEFIALDTGSDRAGSTEDEAAIFLPC